MANREFPSTVGYKEPEAGAKAFFKQQKQARRNAAILDKKRALIRELPSQIRTA